MNGTDGSIYGSSLYFATMAAQPDYPRLGMDVDADVCVIGGGLAGLTIAREVARQGWSVILLEAKRIAWNASGRNTGFVLPGFAQAPQDILARVGSERARLLWKYAQDGLDYVRETIRETNMPGIAPVPGWLCVSKAERTESIEQEADLLRDTFGANVDVWTKEQVREQLRSKDYFQALHFLDAFHIHPLNYALGLAEAARKEGVRIFENSPAQAIDPAGVRKRVVTPDARVRANQVVLAGNVHLGALTPRLSQTLLPITTYVVATVPLDARLDEAILYRGAVSDTDIADNHYRVTHDRRLMWSGGMSTRPVNPRRFVKPLQASIAKRFPQLGNVDIDFSWNGTLGNTVHRMPQIGELAPGLWLASGFGGHGLNTTAMAGLLISRGIVTGDESWKAFLPYELVWAGGRLGRAVAHLRYWRYSVREKLAGFASRRGEALQARNVEKAERAAEAQRAQDTQEVEGAALAAASADETVPLTAPEAMPLEAMTAEKPALMPLPEAAMPISGSEPNVVGLGKRKRVKKKRQKAGMQHSPTEAAEEG